MPENLFSLKGVLYSKDCRKVPNKKKPTEPDYEFYSIKIEAKVIIGGRERTVIPELFLDKGVSYEGYEIGEEISVWFYLTGKAINPTWYKSEAKVIDIKLINARGIISKIQIDNSIPTPSQVDDTDDDSDLPF
jgi:hypothetical protein